MLVPLSRPTTQQHGQLAPSVQQLAMSFKIFIFFRTQHNLRKRDTRQREDMCGVRRIGTLLPSFSNNRMGRSVRLEAPLSLCFTEHTASERNFVRRTCPLQQTT